MDTFIVFFADRDITDERGLLLQVGDEVSITNNAGVQLIAITVGVERNEVMLGWNVELHWKHEPVVPLLERRFRVRVWCQSCVSTNDKTGCFGGEPTYLVRDGGEWGFTHDLKGEKEPYIFPTLLDAYTAQIEVASDTVWDVEVEEVEA